VENGHNNLYQNRSAAAADPLKTTIDELVKTPEGRYNAKQVSAVIFASLEIANGVPTLDALKSARAILSQNERRRISATLKSARDIMRK